MKMRGACVLALLAGFLTALPGAVLAGGKVGIIDVDGKLHSVGQYERIVEGLGYAPERINEDILADGEKLDSYSCIILDQGWKQNMLYEKEYEALAGYVKGGGTLLMVNVGAYRVALDPEDRVEGGYRHIRGGGPMAAVTGSGIITPLNGLPEKFRVVERNPYTEGLPDEFAYEVKPPYDMTDERNRRRTEVFRLDPGNASTLIESEAYYEEDGEYNMETPRKGAFLTVNSYGEGQAIWLACRAEHLILEREERNIMRIIDNVFKVSSGN